MFLRIKVCKEKFKNDNSTNILAKFGIKLRMEYKFLEFHNVSDNGKLYENFIQDLASSKLNILNTLAEIISDKKNKIKVKFSRCSANLSES